MTTLITGGTGMVGSYVARILIERGEKPVLFDLVPDQKQVADIRSAVKVVQGNVMDLLSLIKLMKREKVSSVIHTAGMLAAGIKDDPVQGVKVNVEGTANVLEAARLLDVKKVVHVSTRLLYDVTAVRGEALSEDAPKLPKTIYASTKLAAEYLGLNYSDVYGLDFVTLRFVTVFGPGYWRADATPNPRASMIKTLIEKSIQGQPVSVKKPATEQREWLYVKDAAHALVLAMDVKDPKHRVFNIGSGRLYGFQEMIDVIRKVLPEARIAIEKSSGAEDEPAGVTPMPVDIARAREELGYSPRYLLEEAIRDFVARVKSMQMERK